MFGGRLVIYRYIAIGGVTITKMKLCSLTAYNNYEIIVVTANLGVTRGLISLGVPLTPKVRFAQAGRTRFWDDTRPSVQAFHSQQKPGRIVRTFRKTTHDSKKKGKIH